MSEWLRYLVAITAVYRLAYMLANEDGPFDVFSWWRNKLGQEAWYGRGFHCVLCMSFWLSLPAAILVGLPWFIGWLGVAGGVLIVWQIFERWQ